MRILPLLFAPLLRSSLSLLPPPGPHLSTRLLSSASMTVPELKALLRSRGLPVSGKKAELLLRLDGAPSAPPPHPLSNLPPRAVFVAACKS